MSLRSYTRVRTQAKYENYVSRANSSKLSFQVCSWCNSGHCQAPLLRITCFVPNWLLFQHIFWCIWCHFSVRTQDHHCVGKAGNLALKSDLGCTWLFFLSFPQWSSRFEKKPFSSLLPKPWKQCWSVTVHRPVLWSHFVMCEKPSITSSI